MAGRPGFRTIAAGKRHVVTGPEGLDDMKGFVARVADTLRKLSGEKVEVVHVGQRLYAKDRSIPPGMILKTHPMHRKRLRREVMRDIIREYKDFDGHIILVTRAVFLQPEADSDRYGISVKLLEEFGASTFFTLVDSAQHLWVRANEIEVGRGSLHRYTMSTMLDWRKAEICKTKDTAEELLGPNHFFLCSMYNRDRTVERSDILAKLMHDPNRPKIYSSFPMTHVVGNKQVEDEIDLFKQTIGSANEVIYWDPADVDEFFLPLAAERALANGKETIEVEVFGDKYEFTCQELIALKPKIEELIRLEDFEMVEAADITFSLVPEIANGIPALSSGVEAELNRARSLGRLIFICWKPDKTPSPFTTWDAHLVKTVENFTDWLKARKILS